LNATIVIKNAYLCDHWLQRLPVLDVRASQHTLIKK
jgi:hypothetical protein